MEINVNIDTFAYQSLIDLYRKTNVSPENQIKFAIDYYIHHPLNVFEELEKQTEERIDCIINRNEERKALIH